MDDIVRWFNKSPLLGLFAFIYDIKDLEFGKMRFNEYCVKTE